MSKRVADEVKLVIWDRDVSQAPGKAHMRNGKHRGHLGGFPIDFDLYCSSQRTDVAFRDSSAVPS